MCCLKYEQESYEDLLKVTPKVGAYVSTPQGKGNVEEVNLLTGMLKVALNKGDSTPIFINKNEVKIIKDAEIRLDRDEIRALKGLEDK